MKRFRMGSPPLAMSLVSGIVLPILLYCAGQQFVDGKHDLIGWILLLLIVTFPSVAAALAASRLAFIWGVLPSSVGYLTILA